MVRLAVDDLAVDGSTEDGCWPNRLQFDWHFRQASACWMAKGSKEATGFDLFVIIVWYVY